MNVLKPVRVEGDDFTPQSLQRVLFANAPPVLISTDEASTMFELATTQDLRVALANTLISVVADTVKKSTRISEQGPWAPCRESIHRSDRDRGQCDKSCVNVGLTQDDMAKRVLGRACSNTESGVMAGMLLVPANTSCACPSACGHHEAG
jgi:hypothetical protein